ncbi:MAG: FAD-binding protein [Coriobacteriales bacterium]|nr:FAD-binding protein [Coriobacteriales bacterium]
MELTRRNFLRNAAVGVAGLAALNAAPAVMASEAAPAGKAAGTGSATVRGFGGDVTVTLTVDEAGAITDAVIEGANETPERGGRAIEAMQAAYIEGGSLDISGFAGASVTSDAVKSAAAKAFAQASGAEAVTAQVHMAPGQYTGSAVGYWGIWEIPVTITVNETSILAIEVPDKRTLQGETEGFLFPVKYTLFPRIIKHQSTAIDAITGCTATSNAVFQAIDKALAQALEAGGSDPAAIEAFHVVPDEKTELGQVEEINADLAIVGLSTCGLLAMKAALDRFLKLSGRQSRIKIVGIEKCGKLGGHSFMTHSPNAVNPPKRLLEFDDPAAHTCDAEAYREDWLAHCIGADGSQRAKEEMVDLFVNKSGEAMDWLIYNLGWMMSAPSGKTDFSTTDFAGTTEWYYYASTKADRFIEGNEDRRAVMLSAYDKIIQETKGVGGSYLLETEGYELLYDQESNTVTGVKARNLHTGKEYVINAGAVIMSTGSFLNDPELQERLYPKNLWGHWRQNGNTQNTGTMIKAALDIGVAPFNADYPPICMEIGMPFFLQHFPINFYEGKITARTGRQSTWTFNDIPLYMCVSINSMAIGPSGERVCNEYGIANGMEDRVPPDTWVAGPYFYSIWSQDQVDDLMANGFSSENVKRTAAYIQQGGFKLDEPRPETQEALDACVEVGLAWKGDTLEELAQQINVPADALVATVERYNAFCDAGVDEDFGKDAQYLQKIGAGPYYAIKAMNVPYGGGGGLDVDVEMRALKEDGTPINGLYIGGQDSFGVVNNPEKNYIGYGGVDQGWHVLTGKLTGENAAEYVYAKQGLLSQQKA